MTTLFTKIILGEIPSYKIYEDDLSYAFLDINQFHEGKILIVPKVEVNHFFDLDDIYYQAIFNVAKKLSPTIKQIFHSERVALLIEGLEVPHVHIKIFPINAAGDIGDLTELKKSHEEMLKIQEIITKNISI